VSYPHVALQRALWFGRVVLISGGMLAGCGGVLSTAHRHHTRAKATASRQAMLRKLPVQPGRAPWLEYQTQVSAGSDLQLVSSQVGFSLAGQPANRLDDQLAAGPGAMLAWPSPAVMGTANGGRSWRRLLSISAGFWGIDFVDTTHGWAVGVTALYRTVDRGKRWRRASEPGASGGRALVRVAFSGVDHGFGLTTRGRLVKTYDAGASWHDAGWTGRGGALCLQSGNTLTVADQDGGMWRRSSRRMSWLRVAPDLHPAEQYAGWWVELSCDGANGVELAQEFCMAACGGGVLSIVRQTTDGGMTWREIATPSYGAANPSAAVLARVVAVGDRSACLIYDPSTRETVVIRCTSNSGRSFRRATVPTVAHSRENPGGDVFAQGVSFAGPSNGWLLIADGALGAPKTPKAETEIWSTDDGGASWQARYQGPTLAIPSSP
jgi:photosystem II stability/assembly factor-like uncharacterized protein